MAKEGFSYLNSIIGDIEDAFAAFYQTMLTDVKLAVFFESQAQVDALIIKQKEHFRATITMDIEKIKQVYIRLGEYHYELRIPFVDFIKGTKILEEHFILYAHKLDSSEKIINEIFRYFRLMVSFTAKGYLNKTLNEDKRDIDDFFEQSLEMSTFLPKQIVKQKFDWLKRLIEHIEFDYDGEFNVQNDALKEWLGEANFLTPEKRLFFEDIDNRIALNTQNLFYFLKRQEYAEMLPLYTSLLSIYKLTLMINNTMTIEYANKIIEQMKLDTLTQLFRKDIFDEILKKELSFAQRHNDYVLSVAFIDLDNFKNINDSYGHYSGDKVIERLGEVIRENIRTSDYGFRIGGDELALILKNATKERAAAVCEKVKQEFSEFEFIFNDETTFNVGLSIGIAEYAQGSEGEVLELLKEVDKKLYEAKRKGKNQICY